MLEFFWVSCFFISFTILLTYFGLVNCEWNCIRITLFFQKQPSKGVRICSKFPGEHPCRNVISIKLLCNFLEIKLRYGCSPANLLHIFRSAFLKNTTGWLLLFFPISFFWFSHFCMSESPFSRSALNLRKLSSIIIEGFFAAILRINAKKPSFALYAGHVLIFIFLEVRQLQSNQGLESNPKTDIRWSKDLKTMVIKARICRFDYSFFFKLCLY